MTEKQQIKRKIADIEAAKLGLERQVYTCLDRIMACEEDQPARRRYCAICEEITELDAMRDRLEAKLLDLILESSNYSNFETRAELTTVIYEAEFTVCRMRRQAEAVTSPEDTSKPEHAKLLESIAELEGIIINLQMCWRYSNFPGDNGRYQDWGSLFSEYDRLFDGTICDHCGHFAERDVQSEVRTVHRDMWVCPACLPEFDNVLNLYLDWDERLGEYVKKSAEVGK